MSDFVNPETGYSPSALARTLGALPWTNPQDVSLLLDSTIYNQRQPGTSALMNDINEATNVLGSINGLLELSGKLGQSTLGPIINRATSTDEEIASQRQGDVDRLSAGATTIQDALRAYTNRITQGTVQGPSETTIATSPLPSINVPQMAPPAEFIVPVPPMLSNADQSVVNAMRSLPVPQMAQITPQDFTATNARLDAAAPTPVTEPEDARLQSLLLGAMQGAMGLRNMSTGEGILSIALGLASGDAQYKAAVAAASDQYQQQLQEYELMRADVESQQAAVRAQEARATAEIDFNNAMLRRNSAADVLDAEQQLRAEQASIDSENATRQYNHQVAALEAKQLQVQTARQTAFDNALLRYEAEVKDAERKQGYAQPTGNGNVLVYAFNPETNQMETKMYQPFSIMSQAARLGSRSGDEEGNFARDMAAAEDKFGETGVAIQYLLHGLYGGNAQLLASKVLTPEQLETVRQSAAEQSLPGDMLRGSDKDSAANQADFFMDQLHITAMNDPTIQVRILELLKGNSQ